MLNLTGEIAVARERLGDLLDRCERSPQLEEVLEAHRAADRLFLDLQEEVMKIRMVPLGPTFRQFVRTVRDVATAGRKQATARARRARTWTWTPTSSSTCAIRSPIWCATPSTTASSRRRCAARSARTRAGRVRLQACHEGGSIVIQVQDDGAGLDRARIIARARAHGDTAISSRCPTASCSA